ncbi:MAG: glutamine--fructose-6-phosphate transaminase (isomerizing) [Nevskiaceae bacterium]|nr:MAG: glutamine--fructose-6-phosphate transaminase (isomerizing) [Nevskiaceae bacterium]TBR71859.1 MAG: glutamine--fructose-6-phosphate transaminase (isomerizing) [Nevskiaceae bacterium]
MCGLIAVVCRQRNPVPLLLSGLRRVEYRGYDSAGMAILDPQDQLYVKRSVGNVGKLECLLADAPAASRVGIAHTRWATHGEATERNAHPQISRGLVAVVHNGIIENYLLLRRSLEARGYHFQSDTDTEVIAHGIHDQLTQGKSLCVAVQSICARLQGSYALAVLGTTDRNRVVVARRGSPLVVGVGHGEFYAASDVAAILPMTQTFFRLEDGDVAELSCDGAKVLDRDGRLVQRGLEHSDLDTSHVDKGGYRDFMLKEIFEQGRALRATLASRIDVGRIRLDAGGELDRVLQGIRHVHCVACGTSYHACAVAGYLIEAMAGIPATVELASEYRYRQPVVREDSLFVAMSQSGETADTLAALRFARGAGYRATLVVCNVADSSLVREADFALMTAVGPEIGVASTKSFTAQLMTIAQLAIVLARNRGCDPVPVREGEHIAELARTCVLVDLILELSPDIKRLAQEFVEYEHTLFLGRGAMYPVAMEGALKLKEISYIHADAYAAGALKHGPLALVDAHMPVVALAPRNPLLDKLRSNLQEVRARHGRLYIFADSDAGLASGVGATVVKMPHTTALSAPIVYTVPLQLLAYHVAVLRGTNVDQPRNLAKSVTVE